MRGSSANLQKRTLGDLLQPGIELTPLTLAHHESLVLDDLVGQVNLFMMRAR